jgi:hypothetical protein
MASPPAAAGDGADAPPSSPSTFGSLDQGVLAGVLGHLGHRDLAACACACRLLQQLAEDLALWGRALAAYEPPGQHHTAVLAALRGDARAYLRARVEFWRPWPGKGEHASPACAPRPPGTRVHPPTHPPSPHPPPPQTLSPPRSITT